MFLKPSHLLKGLVARPGDVARNFRHMLRMLALKAGTSKPDRYLSSLKVGGAGAEWATTDKGEKICCMYCGHAIARLSLSSGWQMETCSAYGLDKELNSSHTAQWAEQLRTMYETSQKPETSPKPETGEKPEIKANSGDLQRTQ